MKPSDLDAQIRAHPGWIAFQRWEEVKRCTVLHFGNLRELNQLITWVETDPAAGLPLVQNAEPPNEREIFGAWLDQRLHNAIASAVTLADAQRRLTRRYPASDFTAEFETRNAAIRDDARTKFIRRLRNYLLHYGMPPLSFTYRLVHQEGQPVGVVQIDAQAMLASGFDWGADAQRYLHGVGQHVALGELIRWYQEASEELCAWLFAQRDLLHHADIQEVNGLIDQYNEALTRHSAERSPS